MKKITDILPLNETWHEQYSAAEDVARYKTKWVHFTNGAEIKPEVYEPKMGVNPKKNHADPHGIYFYPASYINNSELSNTQFAVDYKYYYICEPVKTARILDLSKMDYNTAYDIAHRKGFNFPFREAEFDPKKYLHKMDKKLYKKPGAILYGIVDWLINDDESSDMTWFKAFGDYDGLKDTSGIINGAEPKQMVIFAKKNVKVIKFGENKDQTNQFYRKFYEKGVSMLSDTGTCKITFKHGDMIMDIMYQGYPVRITQTDHGLSMSYKYMGLPIFKYISAFDMNIDSDYHIKTNADIIKSHVLSALKDAPPSEGEVSLPFDMNTLTAAMKTRYRGETITTNFGKNKLHDLEYTIKYRYQRDSMVAVTYSIGSDQINIKYQTLSNFGLFYALTLDYPAGNDITTSVNAFFDAILNDDAFFKTKPIGKDKVLILMDRQGIITGVEIKSLKQIIADKKANG